MRFLLTTAAALCCLSFTGTAQENPPATPVVKTQPIGQSQYTPQRPTPLSVEAAAIQESCLTTMSGFPNDKPVAKYQFLKLTRVLAEDANPNVRSILDQYSDGQVTSETPLEEVIEGIANPVMRQAMPRLTIAYADYLIDFAVDCQKYVDGQIASLVAFDPTFADSAFNEVISEDALFLRQILTDALYRAGVANDPTSAPTIDLYANSLVNLRNSIEYASFETDISELEALYMEDLDGRLAIANDTINEEYDRELLPASVELAKDMISQTPGGVLGNIRIVISN